MPFPSQDVNNPAIAVAAQSFAESVEARHFGVVARGVENRDERHHPVEYLDVGIDKHAKSCVAIWFFLHRREPGALGRRHRQVVTMNRVLEGGAHQGRLVVEREVDGLHSHPGFNCDVGHRGLRSRESTSAGKWPPPCAAGSPLRVLDGQAV